MGRTGVHLRPRRAGAGIAGCRSPEVDGARRCHRARGRVWLVPARGSGARLGGRRRHRLRPIVQATLRALPFSCVTPPHDPDESCYARIIARPALAPDFEQLRRGAVGSPSKQKEVEPMRGIALAVSCLLAAASAKAADIGAIQGAAHASPEVGERVEAEGVVTLMRGNGSSCRMHPMLTQRLRMASSSSPRPFRTFRSGIAFALKAASSSSRRRTARSSFR